MSFSLRPWLLATRPRTLPAALAPVAVGGAAAYATGNFLLPAVLVCLVFALLMQVTTNFANDYFDHVNGVDTQERIGPTRAVASGQVTPRAMRNATLGVTILALLVGMLLIRYGGWGLLLVGLACALCAIAYTGGPFPLGYNGLGDLFAFLFFGPVAVGGTYYVQAGSLGGIALWSGVGVGLLVANILVVNNYRDVRTDTASGKRTLVVRFGRGFGWWQYVLSLLAALAVPVVLWLGCGMSVWVLLPWLLLLPMLHLVALLGGSGTAPAQWWRGLQPPAEGVATVPLPQEGPLLNRLLGKTAMLALWYALLLSLGLLIA